VPTLAIPLDYIAEAFISVALVTLGVQLGAMKWKFQLSNVLISNTLRLLVGPVFGFLVVLLLGLDGLVAQTLVLSCAVPTSVFCLMLAVEFDNEVEFSSQAVLSSTLFSIFTVTMVIYMLRFI
jgi:predicted permease